MEKKLKKGTPAGLLIRAAARFLDNIIVLILMAFLGIFLALILRSKELIIPVIYGLMFAVPCLYFTITTALWGQTAGKKAFNLKVTRLNGKPLSFPFALWRWVAELCSFLTFGIGYLLVLILPSKLMAGYTTVL
jgi:uncharacterized RDD family membrane protein YckC